MTQSLENDRAANVSRMFSRIANHYDRANRWMTWGQDMRWRREVVDLAAIPKGGRLLDIGSGTGDLALEALSWGYLVASRRSRLHRGNDEHRSGSSGRSVDLVGQCGCDGSAFSIRIF